MTIEGSLWEEAEDRFCFINHLRISSGPSETAGRFRSDIGLLQDGHANQLLAP